MKKLLNNNWLRLAAVLAVGMLIGKLMSTSSNQPTDTSAHQHIEQSSHQEVWTCSMHPQIQQDKPGQCPLCGMDLIPLNNSMDSDEALPDEVPMSTAAMKLAEIQTMIVEKQKPEKEIRLLGKVKPDERLKQSQTVHIPGRIEKLYVNFTGEKVAKGQKIASIYSPQLVTAQKELFEVLKDEESNPAFVKAARAKLKQWKLSDEQIEELVNTKEIRTEFDVLSDHNGYVSELNVAKGDYVKEGQQLFHIVDLSTVWVLFEAYENDLPWIKLGDKVSIEVASIPGRKFRGNITFIDPFVDPKTRVAYVRVELPNSNTLLKPDMFASGIITSKLNMSKSELLVPKSAVLWTGKRAVVYVKLQDREHNSFIYREIILGEDAGDFYIVKTGLDAGEEIAVNGVFKIDAAAQLSGKKSMMNPTGGKVATGHDHDEASEGHTMKPEMKIDKSTVPDAFKKQLGKAVSDYLKIKDKLTNDDNGLKNEIPAFKKSLNAVDMSLVTGDAHNAWMKELNAINKNLPLLSKEVNIDAQRTVFNSISNSMMNATSNLGLKLESEKPVYLQFCPMANDNTGGYWLSTDKAIRNPYFGAKMLKCGSTEDTLTEKMKEDHSGHNH